MDGAFLGGCSVGGVVVEVLRVSRPDHHHQHRSRCLSWVQAHSGKPKMITKICISIGKAIHMEVVQA